MAFDYQKIKSKESGNDFWASYSDLYTVLTTVFLLMYVVSTLRNGTFSIQKHIEYKQMKEQTLALQEQIKVYNNLKDGYLEKEASKDEQEVYNQLMDKLSLLQEEQKDEKDTLRAKALDNEKKEMALNKYQQVIQNIINANIVSKSKVDRRNKIIKENKELIVEKSKVIEESLDTIDTQTEEIAEQEQDIAQKQKIIASKQKQLAQKMKEIEELEENIQTKKSVIAENEKRIESLDTELEKKLKSLEQARTQQKISKQNYEREMKDLKTQAEQEVSQLEQKNQQVQSQLQNYSSQLKVVQQNIVQERKKKDELMTELQSVNKELDEAKVSYAQEVAQMRDQHEEKMRKEREAFDQSMKDKELTIQQKSRMMEDYKNKVVQRERDLKNKLQNLSQNLESKTSELSQASTQLENEKQEKSRAIANLDSARKKTEELTGQNINLSKSLQVAQSQIEAKKKLAELIKKNFEKAGIKSQINPENGDVTLSFGKHYFGTNQANLKPEMQAILDEFMPIYASSLFEDQKIATKIKGVEIIGKASPTYQGRYIDPESFKAEDKKASQYNLDLSIRRAKSIFEYISDSDRVNPMHQQKLRSLVKVSGRGFFAEADMKDKVAAKGMSDREFCKKFDCAKAQTVTIRFELDQ